MRTHYIYLVSALTLALVSCSHEEEVNLKADATMSFVVASPNATRVAAGEFEQSDKVGLYVVDYIDDATTAPLQISGNRANNEAMLFDGSAWATERPIYWGKGKSDVYAYYPYMAIEDVDAQPFAVATDQDVENAYENSDFLWAKAEGVAQTDGAVSLAMKHQMSRLMVKIMAGEEYIGSLPADATVHLHSTVTDARISLANGSVVKDPYGGTHSIKMRNLGIRTFAEGEAVVYEAIVVPQMLLGTVPLLEINSKSVSYLLEDMFNFKPGVSYTYTAVLNASTTSIKVEIGCDIEDWNNIGGGSEGEESEGEEGEDDGIDLSLYTDLSAEGTANCYLVKGAGNYKFKATLGNTEYSVGNVKKTEVLWETFGTDVMPNVGDLIASTGYQDGYIYFSTAENFNNGNASIAARNSKDVILWSWHIWCAEEGWNDQVYPHNIGTMMDRNLGATSATPGDVGAFGLLYQWGRKDPFIGAGKESENTFAASTGLWIVDNSYFEFATDLNPTTFFSNWDVGNGWPTSEFAKGVTDPCPAGYRVPDNFREKVRGEVSGSYLTLADGQTTAWAPRTGYLNYKMQLKAVGSDISWWSASRNPERYSNVYCFTFDSWIEHNDNIFNGHTVRCIKE